MYAVIEVGAKQFNVKEGDIIEVEKQEVEDGLTLHISEILLVADGDKIQVGQPILKGAVVDAEVLNQTKGDKLISFKYRRRKSSHWTKGHRQKLTCLKISKIKFA